MNVAGPGPGPWRLISFASRQVFAKYKTLLSSDNYVTKRMSLKLLGEILLDRSNFNVMCVRPRPPYSPVSHPISAI